MPCFAIAVFAGIRPEELALADKDEPRLMWSDFKWKQQIIRVRAEVAEVGPPRNVKIDRALAAWLELYRNAEGAVCPAN